MGRRKEEGMNKELILASRSPRRRLLLQEAGFTFTVHSVQTDEYVHMEYGITHAIENIALEKAKAVYKKFPQAVVLAADTMIAYHGEVLGKPKDKDAACRMLTMLRGSTHDVITGVVIMSSSAIVKFHEVTHVTFYDLDKEQIEAYLNTPEPYDKAGAYAIQGMGRLFVKKIDGDYFNVVGLPIARVYQELRKMGFCEKS